MAGLLSMGLLQGLPRWGDWMDAVPRPSATLTGLSLLATA